MRGRSLAWIGVVGLLVALVGFGAALYTDRSPFCLTCHEMVPYYEAWAVTSHRIEACIDCHVDPGLPARFAHKFVAMKELWVHVTGEPEFPVYGDQVPDDRCLRCHEEPGPKDAPAGFSHKKHADADRCERCHAAVGHRVSFEVLREAGVLREAAAEEHADYYAPITPAADTTRTPLPDHVEVSCVRCHDMSSAGCDYCHEPPADHYTLVTCARCHDPARTFSGGEFQHSPTLDCSKCHEPPADHFPGVACRDCHSPDVAFDEAEEPGDD